jgi:uncharacterized protein (DUF488 family)
MTGHEVLTIGHSTHPIEKFIALLRQHEVTAVADVRSAPFSRFNPQFNKDVLAAELKRNGIAYVFLGKELGARSNDPSCYENGRVQYERLAKTEVFHAGLDRVRSGAESNRIALMCAEKEPLDCHRTILVARALTDAGMVVRHILADGTLESHEAAMTRLLDVVGLPREDLFRSHEDLVADALIRQEWKVAYVDEKLETEATGGSQ